MAKNTLYGIVELAHEPFGNLRSLPNDTFRLHLGHGVDPVKDLCLLKESAPHPPPRKRRKVRKIFGFCSRDRRKRTRRAD